MENESNKFDMKSLYSEEEEELEMLKIQKSEEEIADYVTFSKKQRIKMLQQSYALITFQCFSYYLIYNFLAKYTTFQVDLMHEVMILLLLIFTVICFTLERIFNRHQKTLSFSQVFNFLLCTLMFGTFLGVLFSTWFQDRAFIFFVEISILSFSLLVYTVFFSQDIVSAGLILWVLLVLMVVNSFIYFCLQKEDWKHVLGLMVFV